MFAYTVQGPVDRPVVKLSGSLTLEHAREIHAALVAQLHLSTSMVLDIGDTDKADVSFIQILCALLKDPQRPIRFFPLPAHLLELAAAVGADSLIKDVMNRTEEHQ